MKKAPLNFPNSGYLYSKFNDILKFASLNSLILFELPGPSWYAFHALLSFEPPEKNDLEKGILFEFPYGIAMPEKK